MKESNTTKNRSSTSMSNLSGDIFLCSQSNDVSQQKDFQQGSTSPALLESIKVQDSSQECSDIFSEENVVLAQENEVASEYYSDGADADGSLSCTPSLCRRDCEVDKFSGDSSDLPCGQFVQASSEWKPLMKRTHSLVFTKLQKPPSRREVVDSLSTLNLPDLIFEKPFFSNFLDVKGKMEVGGTVLDLTSKSTCHLEEFKSSIPGLVGLLEQQKHVVESLWGLSQVKTSFNHVMINHLKTRVTSIVPLRRPPTVQDVVAWNKARRVLHQTSHLPSLGLRTDEDLGVQPLQASTTSLRLQFNNSHDNSAVKDLLEDTQFCRDVAGPSFRNDPNASACQVKGVNSSPGFKMVLENLQSAKTLKEYQYITILSMEIHICSCGTLNPNPERDSIRAVFYHVSNDVPINFKTPSELTGIIAVNDASCKTPVLDVCGIDGFVEYANDETALLRMLVGVVKKWDPDILAGFEIEMLSWGYVLQRASVLGVNLLNELSRIPNQKEGKITDDFDENNGLGGLKITGRIVLDGWRLFRSEVPLQSYTYENLMYHVLHQRVSCHSFATLSRWWEHPTRLYRWMTVRYYQQRVNGLIRLLDQLDIIGRTSELARIFGIQFFEVLSRGSQFRVESMMLRLAKPMNYIPVSPSVQQRAHMKAPECLPLIMEPESRFYSDPLIVLDFQSLYPSMIIAYNYCFSTCLGRVEHLGKSSHFEFGCTELRVNRDHLQELKDNISVSPNGVAFTSKTLRPGILPRMLEEILEARLAVKQSMKHHKNDHTLQRVLHARQLGLKLIANVTYGYTSANFSGRMPCIEIGDSIVSKGRETLERAISLVHGNGDWGARVVYGDTDSLFVLVPGRSRQEAFRIGAEIAAAVTQDNPTPVKLKLEKVYQPSILQTKKRYVGYMYESADQKQPVYEAKGIETVRRDGCPAVVKMLEKSLRILFETSDVSSVKNYVTHQFTKILSGRANVQDLIFAKEYRGKKNYRPGACVPALELTKRWLRQDCRAEPRIGERVPYVIVNGPPGSTLINLVRHPNELLTDPSLRYNGVYYVTRAIIPPLARCLSLLGADVSSWYLNLPRRNQVMLPSTAQTGLKKTISQYFTTMECACCGDLTNAGVCEKCSSNPQLLVSSLSSKIHQWEFTDLSITKICQSCLGRSQPLDCCSLDCPITYRRHQSSQRKEQSAFVSRLLNDFMNSAP